MDRKEKEILGAAVVMLLAFGFLAIFQPWKNAFKSDNMDAQGENEPTDNQWQNGGKSGGQRGPGDRHATNEQGAGWGVVL